MSSSLTYFSTSSSHSRLSLWAFCLPPLTGCPGVSTAGRSRTTCRYVTTSSNFLRKKQVHENDNKKSISTFKSCRLANVNDASRINKRLLLTLHFPALRSYSNKHELARSTWRFLDVASLHGLVLHSSPDIFLSLSAFLLFFSLHLSLLLSHINHS